MDEMENEFKKNWAAMTKNWLTVIALFILKALFHATLKSLVTISSGFSLGDLIQTVFAIAILIFAVKALNPTQEVIGHYILAWGRNKGIFERKGIREDHALDFSKSIIILVLVLVAFPAFFSTVVAVGRLLGLSFIITIYKILIAILALGFAYKIVKIGSSIFVIEPPKTPTNSQELKIEKRETHEEDSIERKVGE